MCKAVMKDQILRTYNISDNVDVGAVTSDEYYRILCAKKSGYLPFKPFVEFYLSAKQTAS